MIQSWNELGELLAEWENRFADIESRLPYAKDIQPKIKSESLANYKTIEQIKAELIHHRKEIAELQNKVDKLEGIVIKKQQPVIDYLDDSVNSVNL